MTRIRRHEAAHLATSVLRCAGASDQHAALQADVLIEAELRGLSSHGLLRLRRIVERIEAGLIDPVVTGEHEWIAEAVLRVNGQRGLGPVVALNALDLASVRARHTGIASVHIRNSNHLGMLAYYVERIAEQGQVVLALTNSEALVHPWGGRLAMVGSNPIAIGVPASPAPLVLDMATSLVAMGKIHDYAHRDLPLPEGWAIDAAGEPTTDAEAAKSGSIAPFGGPKGAGLGIALEAMVGVLAGSSFAPEVRGTLDSTYPCTKGDVFIVIEVPEHEAKRRLSAYLDDIRATPRLGPDPVIVPGDGARHRRGVASLEGFDVADEVWQDLASLVRDTIPAEVGEWT